MKVFRYEMPENREHKCYILNGAVMPEREIDYYEPDVKRPRVTEAC